ncbi:Na+/H+ antiporter NhaA [Nitrogeniibacter mangrovi]|uniref:Na(+)/H(+) antiporter NhaA n=1 Tax=Nitrogeniibacter mangrovi TaxID=2016596 RepID=A0A6C1B3Y3_9RHOO|nr:Na+/H+ antiporter NhaA [Nitrogeniibacter mangrovi]QID18257.1 Na+/H+ antiporter NhaA [Nitrogeniibacter mangrovi]
MTHATTSPLARLLKHDATPGLLLVATTLLAIAIANSPASAHYDLLVGTPVEIRIGELELAKPLLLWVNDGLMAVFFLLVGLELKREFLEGELSDWRKVVLPGLGALGGMAVPALVYLLFNHDSAVAREGWAIPAATDIAFALGVLMLLGKRVPLGLKVFLTSLAIFDDVGAIIIIALFYTSTISLTALLVAGGAMLVLLGLNRGRITHLGLYLAVGTLMWVATLKSGVHATLAGVLLALFIPMRTRAGGSVSPLKHLEHELHPLVTYLILPVFAFCNAGLDLRGVGLDQVFHPVPVGIALGLFLGKQIGVFAFCWIGIRLGLARLPAGVGWAALYGTAALCGIGFTMSLFIGSLAFENSGVNRMFDERLGILVGSLASGVLGYAVLRRALTRTPTTAMASPPSGETLRHPVATPSPQRTANRAASRP